MTRNGYDGTNWNIKSATVDNDGGARYLYLELRGVTHLCPRNVEQFPAMYGQFERKGRNLVWSVWYSDLEEGDDQVSYLMDDIAWVRSGNVNFAEWVN